MAAVIAVNCWVGIPFNMLLLTSGLTGISQELYESASVDGAKWGTTLPLHHIAADETGDSLRADARIYLYV